MLERYFSFLLSLTFSINKKKKHQALYFYDELNYKHIVKKYFRRNVNMKWVMIFYINIVTIIVPIEDIYIR